MALVAEARLPRARKYLIKLRIRAGCARNTYPTSAHRPPASHGTSRKGPHTAEEVAARAVGRKHPPVSGEKRSLCTLGVPLGRSRGIGRRVHTRALCLPSRGGGHGATRVGRVRDKIRYDAENLFNWWSPCRVPTNGHNLCSTARRRARISPWLRSVSMEYEGTGGIPLNLRPVFLLAPNCHHQIRRRASLPLPRGASCQNSSK